MKAIKLTNVAHFAYGLLTILAAQALPVLALVMFFTFLFYELDEELHLNDEAYEALYDYALGLSLGLILFLLFPKISKV